MWLAVAISAPSLAAADDPRKPPAIETMHVPLIPDALWERLEQYQNIRAASFSGWSPDGNGILIGTRFGATTQLHRVYAPGGRREQITFLAEPVGGRFLPQAQDGGIVFTMSRGGDENGQIYFLDRQSGQKTLLSDGASRNLLEALEPSGRRIAFASNRRNGRDSDLYLMDARRPEGVELVLEVSNQTWSIADWSPDGSKWLVERIVSRNESYPGVLDLATKKVEPISIPGGGTAAYGSLKFLPDGKTAFASCDAASEFLQLAKIDLATGAHTWFLTDIPWDVESIEVEPKTGLTAVTFNEDGASSLYLIEGDAPRRVEIPLGVVGSLEFSPDGKHLGMSLAQPSAPAEAYSLELATGKLTRWTYSEVGGLDTSRFRTAERIQFTSFDGRVIPAYCAKPAGAAKDRKVPVVISIHGGPEGQSRPYFSGFEQFLMLELGVAVIQPNVRGSSGYGKTYLKLDNADRREDSVKDIGALLDWIQEQPDLDANRVVVMGGSYGGYMVLASLVHYSPRLKGGIDIVGIASFRTFLNNTSPYRQDLRRAEYGDERTSAMQSYFQKIDPLEHTDKIKTALLVAHGKNDPRVPFSEAVQIVERVQSKDRPVWTIFAANEGHGFARKENRDYFTAAMVLFLQHHLLDAPPAAAARPSP